jgi:pSer/pThr/pTyr-binding forkhead associated (FHA) protein
LRYLALLRYVQDNNMPKLVIGGVTHELVEDLITIGRGPDNMIVIADPSVSSHHAELQLAGETYRLKDLDSTNGTRVNGIPATEAALHFDDRIRFGGIEARYEADPRGSQPLPQLKEIEAKPADLSAAPVDFANASPFPRQQEQKDPTHTAIFVGAAIVLFVFLVSMIAVLMMHAPAL